MLGMTITAWITHAIAVVAGGTLGHWWASVKAKAAADALAAENAIKNAIANVKKDL